jgi:hypothetical protein
MQNKLYTTLQSKSNADSCGVIEVDSGKSLDAETPSTEMPSMEMPNMETETMPHNDTLATVHVDSWSGMGHTTNITEPTSDIDSENSEGEAELGHTEFHFKKEGEFTFPPSVDDAHAALEDLKTLLKPPRENGPGYQHHDFDELTYSRLEAMRGFLWKYISGRDTKRWTRASLETAQDHERGPHHARLLQKWAHAFLANREDLPTNMYGTWKTSILDDEKLQQHIHLHLQSLGPYVRAQDLVDFIKKPETVAKFNLKKPISLATAQRWMKQLSYRWTVTPTGQYETGS